MTILEPEINIDKENPVRLLPVPNPCPAGPVEPQPAPRVGEPLLLPWSSTAPRGLGVLGGC